MTDLQKTEEKSHAERIASFLEQMEPMFPNPQAAAELRRLHVVNEMLIEGLEFCADASHITYVREIVQIVLTKIKEQA